MKLHLRRNSKATVPTSVECNKNTGDASAMSDSPTTASAAPSSLRSRMARVARVARVTRAKTKRSKKLRRSSKANKKMMGTADKKDKEGKKVVVAKEEESKPMDESVKSIERVPSPMDAEEEAVVEEEEEELAASVADVEEEPPAVEEEAETAPIVEEETAPTSDVTAAKDLSDGPALQRKPSVMETFNNFFARGPSPMVGDDGEEEADFEEEEEEVANPAEEKEVEPTVEEEATAPTTEEVAPLEEEAAPVADEEEVAPAVEEEATAPATEEEEAIPTETEETAENTPSPTDADEEVPTYPEDLVWEPSIESVDQDGSVLLGYYAPLPQESEEPNVLDVVMQATMDVGEQFSYYLSCGGGCTPAGNMNEENCLQQAPVEQPAESEPTEEEAADEEPSAEDSEVSETVRSSSFDRTASAKKQVNLDVGNNIGDEISPEEEDNRNECSDVNPAMVEVEARC